MAEKAFTRAELIEHGHAIYDDLKADFGEVGDEMAFDAADGVVMLEERVIGYYKEAGVDKKWWRDAFADLIVER